jgi:hypothetical protein
MYTLKLPICIPVKTCGKPFTGQHAIGFHQPHILADVVPLGFCCGGFSSTVRLRSDNVAQLSPGHSPPPAGPLQRVLLVFIRVAQESLATFSS